MAITAKELARRLGLSEAAVSMALIESGEEVAPCYFADNDLIAIGVMKAFQRKGYVILDDVAIVGFDDLPMSGYMEPPRPTVNVPKQYMGELAVNRLIEIMRSGAQALVKIEVSTSLNKRSSA